MKENEFDIQVRKLLQNAEEPVSPQVWEGIAAGLERRRRVVPVWVWRTAAGVAAAAAVVAGVVFLNPSATVTEDHSNPITIAEAPATLVEESIPAAEQEPASPETASRRKVRVALAMPASPDPVQEEGPSVGEIPVGEQKPSVQKEQEESAPVQVAPVQDAQTQFDLLARAEEKPASGRGFSLTASGNLQGLRRSSVGGGFARPYSAPPAIATNPQEKIDNENPEIGFSLPFSAGIGLKYNFTQRWSVGIGVRYTNLSRTFVGDYVGVGFREIQTDIDNHQHWLGVPVHLYYDIVNRGRWRVHTFAGASAEFLVDNDFLIHGSSKDFHYHQRGTRPQWSGDLGLGVEFRITPVLGIYLDPSFRYFFRTDLQPRSIRTIQPLRFDLEAGLRFSFGE
ncbi:MAG: outer membrane beta-barrel protein [Bacteroidales bacterium]|nr:outer membrane beta-barrel protein [Bacteroidales bacterium]